MFVWGREGVGHASLLGCAMVVSLGGCAYTRRPKSGILRKDVCREAIATSEADVYSSVVDMCIKRVTLLDLRHARRRLAVLVTLRRS